MVDFRPHTLDLIVTHPGYYDEKGSFVEGGQTVTHGVRCRYEPNGRARSIALEDGSLYMYSYMVYLDTDCPEISFGDEVELFDQSGISRGKFTAHGFHRGQLNSKLWL